MMMPAKYTARFINGNPFKPADWGEIGLPILRIAQLSGQDFDNYFDGSYDARYKVHDGDLLFAWSATIESYLWNRGDALLNQHIFKVVPFKGVAKRYLFYSLKHYSRVWADVDAHGSTTTHIKKESLSNKIFLPDADTQESIADLLNRETSRIDQLIEKKHRLLELLRQKKKSEHAELVKRGIVPNLSLQPGGPEWMGEVPSHWKPTKIKHLFRQCKRQNYPDKTVLSVYRDFGVIVKDSRDDNINRTPEDLTAYQLVRPGDLVINKMKAWQGSLGISSFEGITSPDYVVFSPIGGHHPRFLHHYLRADPLPSVYRAISNGIRPDQWRLEPQKFRDLPVWLPSEKEQIAIAQHIDQMMEKLDVLSSKTLTTIERLGDYRAALITAFVTGQLDINSWNKNHVPNHNLTVVNGSQGLD